MEPHTEILFSLQQYYRHAFEESLKMGYHLPQDAISVIAAKASRDIASSVRILLRKYLFSNLYFTFI